MKSWEKMKFFERPLKILVKKQGFLRFLLVKKPGFCWMGSGHFESRFPDFWKVHESRMAGSCTHEKIQFKGS